MHREKQGADGRCRGALRAYCWSLRTCKEAACKHLSFCFIRSGAGSTPTQLRILGAGTHVAALAAIKGLHTGSFPSGDSC